MIKLSTILFLSILTNFALGQNMEDLERKMKNFGTQENTKSWLANNFIFDMKVTAGAEIMLFPITQYGLIQNGTNTLYWSSRPFLTTIASFAIEPRLNLTQLSKNKVLFMKAPTGLGLSITSRSTYEIKYGVFHFNTGLLLGIGSGFHSSKSNVETKGFAVSLGFQYLRAPMTGHTIASEYEYTGVDTFDDKYTMLNEPKKNWLLPTVQVDLYYLNKHKKPRGYSFTVSMMKAFYFKFAIAILDKAK